MTAKSLTTLVIEHDQPDGDHYQISVGTGLEVAFDDDALWEQYGDPGRDELDEALTYLRGVLGRLTAVAGDWILAEARDHGCRRYFRTRDVSGREVDIGDPAAVDLDSAGDGCAISPWDLVRYLGHCSYPRVYFYVPPKHGKAWVKRIQRWLAEIDATDQRDEDPS